MMDQAMMSVKQAAEAIRSGRLSSVELTRAVFERIAEREERVGAYLALFESRALEHAGEIDRQVASGEPVGPLAGVPIAIKDNLCTRYGVTSCGSRILEQFHAPYNAHVVEQLHRAGAVVVGKTNMDEFAMGSSTENSGLKQTANPWSLDRVPGGSSGGSAAAVAAGMCCAAIGSDTGGSIRQPASFCGVVGLKPTYGRVSRYGLVAYGSSLDQIGPITRDVTDAAVLLGVLAGHDLRDSTSVSEQYAPSVDYAAEIDHPIKGLRIGVAKEFFEVEGLDPEVDRAVRQALSQYEAMGATLVEVSIPHLQYAIAAYYLIATAEASSNLARYDGVHYGHRTAEPEDYIDVYNRSRAEGFGPEVKRRIMLGAYALSAGYYDAYYLKALKVRTLLRQDCDKAFESVDCLICPTAPEPAFARGDKTDDPLRMYLSDIYTITANLAGIPGVSVPCGFSEAGLPIGLQIVTPAFTESTLLRIARMFEAACDLGDRQPCLAGGD